MKITDLKKNECILCPTVEIYKKIVELNNEEFIEIEWMSNKEKTIYYPKHNRYVDLDYAEEMDHKVYKHTEFLKPSLKSKVKKLENKLIQTRIELRGLKSFVDDFCTPKTDNKPELPQIFYDFAELIRLRDEARGGWLPDWSDLKQDKYLIVFTGINHKVHTTLSFQSSNKRDNFLKVNKDLILKCKDLLS